MISNNNKKIKTIIKCALLFLALFSLIAVYKGCGSNPSTSNTASASVSALKRTNVITSEKVGCNYLIYTFLNDSKESVNWVFSQNEPTYFKTYSVKVSMPVGMANGNIGYVKLYSGDVGSYDVNYSTSTSYPYLVGGIYNLQNIYVMLGYYDLNNEWTTSRELLVASNNNNVVNFFNTFDLQMYFIGKPSNSTANFGLVPFRTNNSFNYDISMFNGVYIISGYENYLTSYEAGVENGILQGIQQVIENPNDNGLYSQTQYDDNFQAGYNEGAQSNINVSWIEGILNSATSVLNLEVLPGIKIIYLAGVFIVIKFVVFILGVIK